MSSRRNFLPDLWQSNQFNPMREMTRLQRDMDRMFDDFLSPSTLSGTPGREMAFSPPCDIEETDTHFLMTFDMPGISKKDVRIELRDNQLLVSGERQEQHRSEKNSRVNTERFHGTFVRSFTLPSNVDPEKVEAHYEDGVLRIAVPKSEAAKPRQISINESKGGFFKTLLGHREKEEKSEKAA